MKSETKEHYLDDRIEEQIQDLRVHVESLLESDDSIVSHLNQLGKLRQQQRSETEDLKRQIQDLKGQIATLRSWAVISVAGVVGVALLSAVASIANNYQMQGLKDANANYQISAPKKAGAPRN